MGSGPPGSREAANGGSPGNQGVKAASAAGATNGGSALPSAQLGMKRCFFVYQVLVGYNVKVQVRAQKIRHPSRAHNSAPPMGAIIVMLPHVIQFFFSFM